MILSHRERAGMGAGESDSFINRGDEVYRIGTRSERVCRGCKRPNDVDGDDGTGHTSELPARKEPGRHDQEMCAAMRSATAAMVWDGLRPVDVGSMEPSAMMRLG